NAALAAHVDRATIIDLLDSEDWWAPYREEFPLVRLIVGDSVVATRGTTAGANVEGEIVKAARRQTAASGQVTIGAESFLLAAARLAALSDDDAVIVLGRRAPPAPATVAAPPPSIELPAQPLPRAA